MRTLLLTAVVLTAILPAASAQSKTDPSVGPSGPRWESGKKQKPRDPNTRNVEGVVRMPDDSAAQGAVVKLKNLKTLQIRSFITQSNGAYRFDNLSTNIDYELQANYKNMVSPVRGLSVFDNRLDAVVNLKLEESKKPDSAKNDGGK